MEQKTPERLFGCLCKVAPTHGERLIKIYSGDSYVSPDLPPEVKTMRREHMLYRYRLGETGIQWAGGGLSEFAGTLNIYAVNTMEEAKKVQENDPNFLKGVWYDCQYFEWFIHMPLNKASPAHKARVEQGLTEAGIMLPRTESKVESETPERLFVCMCKVAPSHAQRLINIFAGGLSSPSEVEAIRHEHLRYMYDLAERGSLWAGGAVGEFSGALNVYAVDSLEEAKKAQQDSPYHVKGVWYDDKYFEWFIHGPFSKASPLHKDRIRKELIKFGIIPA